jgi:DNA-binding transcriptional LysR family regulator
MIDSLRGYYVFAQVARTRSFSRAAEYLEITRSAVSKHIQQLEADLGVQLIVRTTRKLALTDAGERVFEAAARLADDAEAARDAAHARTGTIAGKLRVTAPNGLATYLIPVVSEFLRRHADVSIDFVFDDAYIDLIDARIDIALRVGGRTEQTFVSRRIARTEFVIVAAPSYLARHPVLSTARDLSQHEWLVHSASTRTASITMRKGKTTFDLRQQGRLSCNSGPSNRAAAVAGHGMMFVPDFEVAPELKAGTLVRVLPQWKSEHAALQLVFPPRRHVLGRVRAFADFVADRFQDPPWKV